MGHKLTTCTFCGVGCGLYLETAGNHVVGVYPSRSHPTNAGRICVRGWHVHEVTSSLDRLKTPLLRKEGRLREVSWDEALTFIATQLKRIRAQHGPDALAFLNSPRCSNEETYLLQKLARAVVGTNNVDHGTGVYSNNSIEVLREMLGVPASTNSLQEIGESEVIVVDGVDLARRLPTVAGMVLRAKQHGARLIVVGTRRHRVAENADLFLQIRPNTEALLYGAMAKVIVDHGLMDQHFIGERCRDYDAFLAQLRQYDLLRAAEGCGVAAGLIETAALMYARARAASLMYSTSMEERTAESICAVVNLAMLTGNVGKAGAGIYALAEQNNLQGVCDMGMLPDCLPGYQPVADGARAAFEEAWQAKLPAQHGMSARSILTDGGAGRVKAAWFCRYDPVTSATFTDVVSTLCQFELVIIQHLFMTPTAECAHVVLPTTAFGEERVSFTSTDRRIQLAEQAITPGAGQMPAWQQLTEVARRLGANWDYASAADVMDEIATLVPFYSGATYDNLARDYGRQWPCTAEHPMGTRILFADHQALQRFKFVPVPPPVVEAAPADHPLLLVFGNSLYYWNQSVLIRHSETLKREYRALFLDYPEGFVELNHEDAAALKIRDGERIRLCVPQGASTAVARVTPEVMRGTVFVPFFMRDVEALVLSEGDGGSKVVPVRVERAIA